MHDSHKSEDFNNCGFHAGMLHGYLRELPHNIDLKVEIFLGIVAGVFLYKSKAIVTTIGPGIKLNMPIVGIQLVTLVTLLLSIISCIIVIWPRISRTGHGVTFFGDIAREQSGIAFAKSLMSRSEKEIVFDILIHCHQLARIICAKVFWFRIAILTGTCGLLCSLLPTN